MPLAACPAFAGSRQVECGRCTRPAWEHDARLVDGRAIPWSDEMLDQWRAIGLLEEIESEPEPKPEILVADLRLAQLERAHNLCGVCWNRRHPNRPMIPERLGLGVIEECCACGNMNNDGVFWWGNATDADLICNNESEAHRFPLFEEPPEAADPEVVLAPFPNQLTR